MPIAEFQIAEKKFQTDNSEFQIAGYEFQKGVTEFHIGHVRETPALGYNKS